ncbi:GNAT family N-acetyltransferase, partial [Desulfatitalea alkaliphila]
MEKQKTLRMRWHQRLAEVDRDAWDRLAQPLATPLLEWRWLHALETSGSIAPGAGWHPHHLTVWRKNRLVGAAPFYIKTHSDGEFVFDQWWAQLAREAGIPYYPKMVGMSPVTPAVGYRFLIDPSDPDPTAIQAAMLDAVDALCLQKGLAGCHLLFLDPAWRRSLPAGLFAPWQHQSFVWHNEGFRHFEDYLARFKASQRRNIRRERQRMVDAGIDFRPLSGDQLNGDWAQRMYRCYADTNRRYGPWGCHYLNADFFEMAFTHYRHRLLLINAEQQGHTLALAMLLHKGDHLLGRYWGAERTIKDLHFNMCFYEPIQWAIDHQIRSFDPGAGSPHKIQRGFQAVTNTSLHRFYEPRLQLVFNHLIQRVNRMEQANI